MVAIALTGLLGFSALVVDIGMLWNAQQTQRAYADSAALAGAQEMQVAGTRGLNSFTREEGRGAAMANIVDQVGGSGLPACAVGGVGADSDGDGKFGYAVDVLDCPIPGTDYLVSVLTPSPICVDCYDNARSIMVEVTRQNVPTFFAGLFGVDGWTSRQTSVASIGYKADFAVLTLRPPHPDYDPSCVEEGCDTYEANVEVSGSSASLIVSVGDIGTNTNLDFNDNATFNIDDGYVVHHYDRYQAWGPSPPGPLGKRLFDLIDDPNYPYPSRASVPPSAIYADSDEARMSDAECLEERDKVPPQYWWNGETEQVNKTDVSEIHCLKPGIYNYEPEASTNNHYLILFTPGVYFLDQGLSVGGTAIGGYDGGSPGITLVFGDGAELTSNNAEVFALNAGEMFLNCTPAVPPNPPVCVGEEATAAEGFDGAKAETGGDPNLQLTIMVHKDPNCPVTLPYPSTCVDDGTNVLKMTGGGALYLAGVQYAPTDNIVFTGGTGAAGTAGRVVAWTVLYTGGAQVDQAYPGTDQGNGILRLDQACSGGGSTGMTNASCDP